MTKVLWHSVAPICPTLAGYGTQTALFAPRLAALDGVALAISSGFGIQGRSIEWKGLHVYPGEDWNRAVIQWVAHHGAGDPVTVITLMDVWPLDRQIFKAIHEQGHLACWVPVDHKPAPSIVTEFFETTGATPIAMSRFGEAELRAAGLDPLYVPHGVNTAAFRPVDKAEARKALGFPEDKFIVGMVANNQGIAPPRKAFSEAFMAFSMFRQTHPDAMLYLHCEMSGFRNGIDLWRLAQRFEIPPDAIAWTEQISMEDGFTDGKLAVLYNCFDVLLNASYGEGFGVPIVEAQACGTPVIVTDWTSMPELCGAGWLVGGHLWDDPKQEAFFLHPDPSEIVAALEKAYAARGAERLREQAVEFAAAYDADVVMETYWKPALERLWAPREVAPLPLNRRQQRKIDDGRAAIYADGKSAFAALRAAAVSESQFALLSDGANLKVNQDGSVELLGYSNRAERRDLEKTGLIPCGFSWEDVERFLAEDEVAPAIRRRPAKKTAAA